MKKFIAVILASSPVLALAAPLTDINTVAQKATDIGDLIIKLAISFAIIWIIVSVVRYLIAGGEEGRKKGGEAILYGVVGLFVILSIWGLVYLLTNSFQFGGGNVTPTDKINQIKLPTPPIVPN